MSMSTQSSERTTLIGTGDSDQLVGGKGHDTIYGQGGDDTLIGGKGSDLIYGGTGRDTLIGDKSEEIVFKTDVLPISEPHRMKVTFDFEEAGYRNTLGVYKVNPKSGAIEDVRMVWENASLKGSGGDLIGGKSSFEMDVAPGEQIGFFLVGNGFSVNNFAKLGPGEFRMLDAQGKPATIDSTGSKLAHVDASGKVTVLKGPVYHTAAFGDRARLNSDGIEHTMGYKRSDDGTIQIGFEDLWKGGDRDFDDCVFTVDIGRANIEVLNKHFHSVLGPAAANANIAASSHFASGSFDDRLHGGSGADLIEGNQGNDLLAGHGAGSEWKLVGGRWVYDASAIKAGKSAVRPEDDTLLGGSGDDVLLGAAGDDVMDGGAGNDTLNLEDGDDYGEGGAGDDVVNAGAGNDTVYGDAGNDSLRGGAGDDALHGDEGKDELMGGEGRDTLDGGVGDDKLFGGDGDDEARGGAGNDYVEGGEGNDRLDGDEGDDRVLGGAGNDIVAGGAGKDTLVGGAGRDTIDGGAGDDQLWGGNWSRDGSGDVFVHRPDSGRDQINDFEVTQDQIDLSAFGLSYEDLAARISDKGWATEIDLSGLSGAPSGTALVLKSVKASALSEENFLL